MTHDSVYSFSRDMITNPVRLSLAKTNYSTLSVPFSEQIPEVNAVCTMCVSGWVFCSNYISTSRNRER